MARICQLTGKHVITGNNVSHSNRRTKRKFQPNLMTKKFFLAEENTWLTLKISAAGLRNISKNGLYDCVKKARIKGFLS